MRSCVLFVYWALLLISVVSSGLLFLIVASDTQAESTRSQSVQPESTQSEVTQVDPEDPSFQSEKNETYGTYSNITLNYDSLEENFESTILNAKAQDAVAFKTRQNDNYQEEATTVSASFETITNDNLQVQEVDILAESLTQQPNLSQGISETGQAVVLTLVDTAAAELQSLADPKINRELASRSPVKNSSLLSGVGQPELKEALPTTQIPPPPVVDDTTEPPNTTDVERDDFLLKTITEEPPEVVVIVRAEQKINTNDLELREEDEVGHVISDEMRIDDTFTTAPELNDSAARAQLVGGSRDETAAVILDGLVSSGPADSHEDIPSFSEWAQKRLEEAEKKKTHPNASVQTPGGPGRGVSGMKVRSKNYASPDCGAKIVAVNPEARGAKNVLASTRDEYMLNACTSRVWFVVELCEAVQAKKIELANFELFSSSPKDFSVYVSDRFPTRDWSPVGQFTAKDVKDIQSFVLHPHFFGKFIKVELQSHYGSEHFCPVSLFRAYGTSEFEVLETETEDQILQEAKANEDDDEDSDEEEPLDSEDGDPSRNLFGSARDAVLSIVKKAAEVLVKSSDLTGNNITEIQHSIEGGNILDSSYTSCMTPRYTILCGNCTDQKFASVFQLVSCRDRQLDALLRIDLVNRTLRCGKLCGLHGIEIDSFRQREEKKFAGDKHDESARLDLAQDLQTSFLASLFKPEYIVALCNVLATKERKVVMNTSYEVSVNASEDVAKEDILSIKDTDQGSEAASHHQISATCTLDSNSPVCKTAPLKDSRRRATEDVSEETENVSTASIETTISTESLASQIKPTKTLSKEDLRKESSLPILEPSKEPTEETLQAEALTTVAPSLNLPTPTLKIAEDLPPITGTSVETVSQTVTKILPSIDSQEVVDTHGSVLPDTESAEVGTQVKAEKSEASEPEGKQAKDLGEQDVKLSSQDHLTLDTLFSDLKDFEGDAGNMQNGAPSASSMTQPTASTVPQKESVFLRLSNRIKTLERNMSLSGQYLEELSRRYKKQVEEMQRSFERAVSAMSEESRKSEERDAKRSEEIAVLRDEIAALSKSVHTLLHDQDSWQSRIWAFILHTLLIGCEVSFFMLIYYCWQKRYTDKGERVQVKGAKEECARRRSAENFGSHDTARRTKNRRPSEIASHINGTYQELLIDERCHETKRERKKKRKKEAIAAGARAATSNAEARLEAAQRKSVLNVILGDTLPSRRASSIDPPRSQEPHDISGKRPESAPETTSSWFDDQTERTERAALSARFQAEPVQNGSPARSHHVDELSESNSSSGAVDRSFEDSVTSERRVDALRNSSFRAGILKSARLSSPSFIKTALGTRSKRRLLSNSERWDWNQDSEQSSNVSAPSTSTGHPLPRTNDSANGSAARGLMEESDESRSSSATPESSKKEKKSTGLKKMVKKLF